MRKLATAAFSFAAGTFLAQYWLPGRWLLPAAGILLVFFCVALAWKQRLRLVLLLGGLCFAMGYNWLYTALVQTPAEVLAEGELVENAVLEVCDWPEEANYGAKVTAKLHGKGTRLVKVIYYGGEELFAFRPGDRLVGTFSVKSAARIREDDITTFTSKGVFLLASGQGEVAVESGNDPLRYLPLRMGRQVQDKLDALYTGDTRGFLRAILTGDRSALSPQALSHLSEAGLMHITAVSGMHCAFLLGLFQLVLGNHRKRLLAAVAAPCLLFYMVLVGGSPSVVRACVMLLFLLAASLFDRESDPPTALSAALALILLQNPFAAASISLQLSFAAVAGLLFLTPRVYQVLLGEKKHGRFYYFTASGIAATLGALVFTIPLCALYFQSLVLVSPLSNLLCLWAASAVFSLGLISAVLAFLWLPLGIVLAIPVRFLAGYFLTVARLLAGLPYHAVYFANPYLKYWLVYAYAAFGCCLLGRGEGRRRYATGLTLAAVTLALTVVLGQQRGQAGRLEATVLDVGQGASLLVRSGEKTALMDCGSTSGHLSAGRKAADTLATMGVGRLDYLILSHYHADHANGLPELMARVPVETLLLPDIEDESGQKAELLRLAEDYGMEVSYIREKQAFALGEGQLTLFPPLGSGGINEEGLSLLCTVGAFDLLATGDMSASTERTLTQTYDLPDLEVLLVGHHGSKHSTAEELLDEGLPETAVISVGKNSYGHPADAALQRLARAGVTIYRTDAQGDVRIRVS